MKRFFFFLIPFIVYADINPFNAGLNSEYGLTPQEKAILANKKSIQKLSKDFEKLKNQINKFNVKLVSYDEDISEIKNKLAAFDTILSEIDALNQSVLKLKKELNTTNKRYVLLEKRVSRLEENVSKLKDEIENIKTSIRQITIIQNDNFEYLKNSINVILKTLDEIKKRDLSPKEAMKKAKAYFFAGKLDKAKELFKYTLSKNYLPATSAYYLGEIAFKEKEYQKALEYYKKSIELYPKKTSFTERLLYHTAISFEKLGNKEAAKLTLKKIINDYPNSKYANLAKKELEKLK